MAKSSISDYQAFHGLIKRLLIFGGLWPYANSNILYRSLPYVQILLNLGVAFALYEVVQENFSNVAAVTRGFGIMMSILAVTLKVMCLIIHHEELVELHEYLDPYFEKLLESSKLLKHILRKVNTFKFLSWTLTISALAAVLFNIATPVSFIINYFVLIYRGGYPWQSLTSGNLYKVHFIFETLGSFALFLVTTSVDSLFTLYIFQIIGQLREMSYSISHIDSEGRRDVLIIYECIIQYQQLIKCVKLMETIYGPVIIWIMGTNAVILCALLLQVLQMKNITIIQGLLFTSYSIVKIVQTFMYGWSGSCLTEESEFYKNAIYSTNWYGKKTFMTLIVICLAQKPLTLTACNFASVSMKIFISVLEELACYKKIFVYYYIKIKHQNC